MKHWGVRALMLGGVVLAAAMPRAADATCWVRSLAHATRLLVDPAAADTLQFHAVTGDSMAVIPPLPGAPAPPRPRVVGGHPGDIFKMGSDIHIEQGETIEGDVVALGGSIVVDGHVQGAVVSVGGDVTLSSTARVDGDVGSVGGELKEEPGDVVGGERFTATRHGGARRMRTHLPMGGFAEPLHFVSTLIKQLLLIALAWLVARFAAGRTAAAVDTLRRETAASVGIGALVWALFIPSVIALALVMAILCITLIGIPLALAALVGYVGFFIVFPGWGIVVGAAALGHRIAAQRGQPAPTLAQAAVIGMGAKAAISIAGAFLRLIGIVPPIHGLGTFLGVVSAALGVILATIGGGAWLRSEFATGALGRWWAGRRTMPGWPGRTPPPPMTPAPGSAPYAGAPGAAYPGYTGTPPAPGTPGWPGTGSAGAPQSWTPPPPPQSWTPPPPPPSPPEAFAPPPQAPAPYAPEAAPRPPEPPAPPPPPPAEPPATQ